MTLAGKKPDVQWFDLLVRTLGLSNRLSHHPNELSGGQQQRVAIARALITKPELVFADDPTGALDSASSAEVLSFLRSSVKELGQTIVMVTHDPVAASYADRAIVFADGQIVADVNAPTSGGQQQRVAIARALITKPELVFADEPTGALDSASSAEVLSFLRSSVKELGQTIVMVTHDPEAASYADRASVFADGPIVAEVHAPTAAPMSDLLMQERARATRGPVPPQA